MLLVNVLQRSVGFLRGLGFARFLSDVELGQWALLNSFLLIAVPIAALGFPGSFGKFVEYFRQRSQLRIYVRNAVHVASVGAVASGFAILAFPDQFSWLIFGVDQPFAIVLMSLLALLSAMAFSFTTELATGLRQVKTVSSMHFTQSLVFAVVGLSGVAFVRSWWVLLPSYCVANLIAMLPGWFRIGRAHADELWGRPKSTKRRKGKGHGKRKKAVVVRAKPKRPASVWKRVLPFAMSLWVMNLLSNLFEVSDRYMLLHLGSQVGEIGQAMVGQYHCARILPNLLISVAMTLGGILLPYLSLDWEAGRREAVFGRVRQLMLGVATGFLAFGVVALLAAPLLFEVIMQGRYELAHSLLPLALAQAIWVSLYLVSEPYLLCVERGKHLTAILVVSLAANFALNWLLIAPLGLLGAMLATTTANTLALGLVYMLITRTGARVPAGLLLLSFAPLSLLGGPITAMLCLTAIVFLAGRTEILFDARDREQIEQLVRSKLDRFGVSRLSIWP